MNKIFSTRVDDSVLIILDELSKRLKKSKKKIIEEAIEKYAEEKKDAGFDILKETSGCWVREESVQGTIVNARDSFTETFKRHHE